MRYLLTLLLHLLLPVAATAEIYRGIGPLDTLADIKAMLPGAKLEQLHPAWAQEKDVLYQLTGPGISGTIIVKFEDGRPFYRNALSSASDDESKKLWSNLLADSNDDTVTVEWVRWVPDSPIPLQRFVAKYGEPDVKGFSDEDLQPFRLWKKGLTAFLSDDEKRVVRVDYEFTFQEQCVASKAKYGKYSAFADKNCSGETKGRATLGNRKHKAGTKNHPDVTPPS